MNCRQAKSTIKLWDSGMLDAQTEQKLRRHVAVCPHCRQHWQKWQASLAALREGGREPINTFPANLWASLSSVLARRQRFERLKRFNGWVPMAAVIVGCLVLVAFSHSPSTFDVPTFDVPTDSTLFVTVAEPLPTVDSLQLPSRLPLAGSMSGISQPVVFGGSVINHQIVDRTTPASGTLLFQYQCEQCGRRFETRFAGSKPAAFIWLAEMSAIVERHNSNCRP